MQTLISHRVHTTVESPLGDLTVVAEDNKLTGLYFADHRRGPAADSLGVRDEAGFEDVRRQLGEYFAGERREFALPLAPVGDAFQHRVWELLAHIPYGRTRSYGDLARELGDPALAQAVGAAVGRNPISVIVPCHRVVGADGSLVGYAGGLWRKRHLLDLEEPAPVKADRLF
ncbi:methylated-DNA--[protein]-cysteine S-methyltransferase [Streptomyces sp. SID3212]|uniref:methylated-DNA--[protein]-cysteine S-methyltransferase n=1 Tax=unclassified Streptomyces TaxID=2593676 RepID=UPI00136D5E97|nr:methylated-DNA--[protein]-cysteine S-methyltransferase [Streptomyces sp. SID3212]MYV52984.1 methylated-DNA--[protein]-cysteine S-methyltransferase [Streptomyces sp. SID3212]